MNQKTLIKSATATALSIGLFLPMAAYAYNGNNYGMGQENANSDLTLVTGSVPLPSTSQDNQHPSAASFPLPHGNSYSPRSAYVQIVGHLDKASPYQPGNAQTLAMARRK